MKEFVYNMMGTLGVTCLTLSIVLSPTISNADVTAPDVTITNNCGAAAGNPNSTPQIPCSCPGDADFPVPTCIIEVGSDPNDENEPVNYGCTPMERTLNGVKYCNCEC